MFRPLTPQMRHVKWFVIGSLWVLAFALVAFWVWWTYKTRVEMEILKRTLDTHLSERVVTDKAMQEQLDAFYRTLYTDPEAKAKTPAPIRQPSTVELWQRNRDKELRDRILRMERWRLDMERQMRELR